MTLGQAKTQVAQQASKQNTSEFKNRALQSIAEAVIYWNRYNWRWLMKQAADATLSASATAIDVPWDYKDTYTLRVIDGSTGRALINTNRRLYDRVRLDQTTAGLARGYDIFPLGDNGALGIQPALSASATVQHRYYRRMWVPCDTQAAGTWDYNETSVLSSTALVVTATAGLAGLTLGSPITSYGAATGINNFVYPFPVISAITPGSTGYTLTVSGAGANDTNTATFTFGGDNATLDVPEDYVDGILSRATAHFLAGLGAPENRLAFFIQRGEDTFNEARRANEDVEDADISFELGNQLANPFRTY